LLGSFWLSLQYVLLCAVTCVRSCPRPSLHWQRLMTPAMAWLTSTARQVRNPTLLSLSLLTRKHLVTQMPLAHRPADTTHSSLATVAASLATACLQVLCPCVWLCCPFLRCWSSQVWAVHLPLHWHTCTGCEAGSCLRPTRRSPQRGAAAHVWRPSEQQQRTCSLTAGLAS
jgi:hypothetical protein